MDITHRAPRLSASLPAIGATVAPHAPTSPKLPATPAPSPYRLLSRNASVVQKQLNAAKNSAPTWHDSRSSGCVRYSVHSERIASP